MKRSESTLRERARSEHRSLIGDLFERHQKEIFRYFYYRIGDPHIAEDLTSEVFLRALQALPDLRIKPISFQAWLFQIARNLSIDHYRKTKGREERILEEQMNHSTDHAERTVDLGLTGQKLRDALAELPAAQRDVIIMRFVAGMPVREVATVLEKSEDAIKSLQRRGLQALRDKLIEWEITYV